MEGRREEKRREEKKRASLFPCRCFIALLRGGGGGGAQFERTLRSFILLEFVSNGTYLAAGGRAAVDVSSACRLIC